MMLTSDHIISIPVVRQRVSHRQAEPFTDLVTWLAGVRVNRLRVLSRCG
jgi:hypothetical protein